MKGYQRFPKLEEYKQTGNDHTDSVERDGDLLIETRQRHKGVDQRNHAAIAEHHGSGLRKLLDEILKKPALPKLIYGDGPNDYRPAGGGEPGPDASPDA